MIAAVIHNTIKCDRLAIHELSALVAIHNRKQTDQNLCFADIQPPPTENLAAIVEQMQAAGYSIGDARRFEPSRKKNHTEWHVPVANFDFQGVLAFFVPEDVC